MGDMDKSVQEFADVVQKCCDDMKEFIYKHIKPRPPIRVWERREDALALSELRQASIYGPRSLRSRAPVKFMT